MKEITKKELETLIKNGYVRNSNKGLVDPRENTVGFYRTRNKRYIEDKYAEIARNLS